MGHVIRDEKALQQPARLVHNDYADDYLKYIRALKDGKIEVDEGLKPIVPLSLLASDELLTHRVVVINFWRNVGTCPLERLPLAFCDRRTTTRADLVTKRLDGQ